MALACLIVTTILAGVLLRRVGTERARVRATENRQQAVWLAESGLERAVVQLAASGDYKGETWKLPAEELGGPSAGEVQIHVERVPEQPRARRIRAEADYPAGSVLRVRQTRELIFEVDPETSGERP
jgi:hypothetical protein